VSGIAAYIFKLKMENGEWKMKIIFPVLHFLNGKWKMENGK
jgi:hypothetical protein